METYIKISTLNDFIFCPKSIYYHNLYDNYDKKVYQEKPQIAWTIAHQNIDNKTYSTEKKYLQAMEVYSVRYWLLGKIDLFDIKEKKLIERKYKVEKLYYGYYLQVYAQYFCLEEMWYNVEKIAIHSIKDNKTYDIRLPSIKDTMNFVELIEEYNKFDIEKDFSQNINKCKMCIYRELCDFYK